MPIRAGTDIAFLGGLIRYAIEHGRIAHDYLVNYTNAAFIVKDGFKLPEDGLYSGFDAATKSYDKATWNYEAGGNVTGRGGAPAATSETAAAADSDVGDPTDKRRVRPVAPAPAVGLPAAEAAVLTLHAGDG
jgi:anaerobic selenocysteine-containing dehydrogenase